MPASAPWKYQQGGSHEFQPSMVLYESSRLASATQLKPVSNTIKINSRKSDVVVQSQYLGGLGRRNLSSKPG